MTSVWCVRADAGKYAQAFLAGGYVGIGWALMDDLSVTPSRDELYKLYRAAYPEDNSNIVAGQQVGQLARFLIELKGGDTVITPDANTEL
ncbi:hypothetical protein AB4144_51515, partial [Rhizobiaceae sp. 2RAB30]